MLTNVDKAVELFEEARRETGNHYLYFELAYTRHTGWMCWLQNREGGEEHKYNFIPPGQADEPGVACVPVINFLQAWKNCGWEPVSPPPLLPNTEHPFDGMWTRHDKPKSIFQESAEAVQAQADGAAMKVVTDIIGNLNKSNGHRPECICGDCLSGPQEMKPEFKECEHCHGTGHDMEGKA